MKQIIFVTAVLIIATTVAGAAPFPIADNNTRVAGATLVQDVDSPARHPYQQIASASCDSPPAACVVIFPAATHLRVVVQHVSCSYAVTDNGSSSSSIATVQAPDGTADYVLPETSNKDNGSGYLVYIINSDILLYIDKGTKASVSVFNTGSTIPSVTCTLSGYHID